MEHRYFPRKSMDLRVRVVTRENKVYQGRLLELCAIGMRIMIDDELPERIKLVDVWLPGPRNQWDSHNSIRMFVVRKAGPILGLCVLNEQIKISLQDLESSQSEAEISDGFENFKIVGL